MKIDAMSSYPAYHKNGASSAARKSSLPDSSGKTDIAAFSRGQTSAPDKSLLSLRSGILRDISQPASAQELAELKNSIREGSYRRSTDELVDAILSNRQY